MLENVLYGFYIVSFEMLSRLAKNTKISELFFSNIV